MGYISKSTFICLCLALTSSVFADTNLESRIHERELQDKLMNLEFECSKIENELDSHNWDKKLCGFCLNVYTSLKDIVSDKDFEKYALMYLEEFCAQLPKPEDFICHKLVDDHLEDIIRVIKSHSPQEFCERIKLC